MKTRKHIIRITSIIVLSGVLSVAGIAQKGNYQARQQNKLPNLTTEQSENISALRIKHTQQMSNHRADIRILKAELDKLAIADKVDMKKVNNKIDEISAIKSTMTKAKFSHRNEVRNLLTDEQKIVFDMRTQNRFNKGPHNKRGGNGPHHFSRNCPNNQNFRN